MNYYYLPKRRRGRSFKKTLLVLIALTILGYEVWQYFDTNQTFTLAGTDTTILGVFNQKPTPIDQTILTAKLQPTLNEFSDKGWQLALSVYDFKTQSSFNLNSDQLFEAASLTKLPVLLSAYYQIQRGRLDPNQIITVQPGEVQDYGTSVLQYNDPGTAYSVRDLLRYMANRSDNTAFQVLVDHLGLSTIEKNLYDWGFKATSVRNGTISSKEAVRIFDLAYSDKIVTGAFKDEMLGLLVKTNEESRIPAGVPSGVRVIHKTGNAIGGLLDAGVVELKNRPYVIAILTDNVEDETRETGLEAQISKVVYEYMKSL